MPAMQASVIQSQGSEFLPLFLVIPGQPAGMIVGDTRSTAAAKLGPPATATVWPTRPSTMPMTSTNLRARLMASLSASYPVRSS